MSEVSKIKNTFNPADLLTKHLPKQDLMRCVESLGGWFAGGRAEIAPELGNLEEHTLLPIILEQLSIACCHV